MLRSKVGGQRPWHYACSVAQRGIFTAKDIWLNLIWFTDMSIITWKSVHQSDISPNDQEWFESLPGLSDSCWLYLSYLWKGNKFTASAYCQQVLQTHWLPSVWEEKDKQGPCSGPVRMAEEILLPKGVCWRPRLGASFLGVTHPHAPPREHWSYAHCILWRPRPAAFGRLHTVTISASFPFSHAFCWKADLGHVPGSGGRGGWQRWAFSLPFRKVVSAVFNGIGYT